MPMHHVNLLVVRGQFRQKLENFSALKGSIRIDFDPLIPSISTISTGAPCMIDPLE